MKGITVAELIEQLKQLPQDMIVMQEEVSDSGWREELSYVVHDYIIVVFCAG